MKLRTAYRAERKYREQVGRAVSYWAEHEVGGYAKGAVPKFREPLWRAAIRRARRAA